MGWSSKYPRPPRVDPQRNLTTCARRRGTSHANTTRPGTAHFWRWKTRPSKLWFFVGFLLLAFHPFLEPRFLWVPKTFLDDVLFYPVGILKKTCETGYHQPIKAIGNLPAHFTNSNKKQLGNAVCKSSTISAGKSLEVTSNSHPRKKNWRKSSRPVGPKTDPLWMELKPNL